MIASPRTSSNSSTNIQSTTTTTLETTATFSRYLFGYQLFLIAVILFGAVVRATGSGAGCGNHWPLCQGVVVPLAPTIKTIIEFTHRITSGLTLPIGLIFFLLARKLFPVGHKTRNYLGWMLIFLITEGLIGAFLVRMEHVADNTSVYRGFSVGAHLINTFALVFFSSLAWLWSRYPLQTPRILRPNLNLPILGGILLIVITATSGAITALGDTLFPVTSPGEALIRAASDTAHLFVKLRIYHPFVAVFTILYLGLMGWQFYTRLPDRRTFVSGLFILLFTQLALGYSNIAFMAPVGLQVAHLFLAYLIWMKFLIVTSVYRYGLTPKERAMPVEAKFCPVIRP